MPFKMTNFIFWSGVYNAGLALMLTCPPFYRCAGLEHSCTFMGLADRRLFSLHQCGADSGFAGFAPSCCFRVLGIDTPLHRCAVAHSRRSFRRSGLDCRAAWVWVILPLVWCICSVCPKNSACRTRLCCAIGAANHYRDFLNL